MKELSKNNTALSIHMKDNKHVADWVRVRILVKEKHRFKGKIVGRIVDILICKYVIHFRNVSYINKWS